MPWAGPTRDEAKVSVFRVDDIDILFGKEPEREAAQTTGEPASRA